MRNKTDEVSGPVVLVTGGAGGLGQVIARVLLEDGYRVAIVDRRDAENAAARLQEEHDGQRVLALSADITDEASVAKAVRTVAERWGRLDALVNNAGIEPAHSLEDLDNAVWQVTLDVNLRGPALLIKHCIPLWRRQGGGRIVSIGSRTWLGGGSTPAYVTSKAGIVGLMREAASELGALGVTANVVAPSFVRTPLNASKGDPAYVESYAQRFAQASPLGRIIEPADVANAVSFLLSDRARNITGEVLHVAAGTQLAPAVR